MAVIVDQSTQYRFKSVCTQTSITLRDLLLADEGTISEYLSLSIVQQADGTKVSLTTSNNKPVTFTGFIASELELDLGAVQLMIEPNPDRY